MKLLTLVVLIFLYPAVVFSWGGSPQGVGYIVKADGTKVYSDHEGDEVDATVSKDFPFVALNNSGAFFGTSAIASEEEKDGRLHVRYWKNGKNGSDGENTAWVDPKDVLRFTFCCDDQRCSGIKAGLLTSRTYSDCFITGVNEAIEKRSMVAQKGEDLEKLKLQLEIEKLKLEQEKMKLQMQSISPVPATTR